LILFFIFLHVFNVKQCIKVVFKDKQMAFVPRGLGILGVRSLDNCLGDDTFLSQSKVPIFTADGRVNCVGSVAVPTSSGIVGNLFTDTFWDYLPGQPPTDPDLLESYNALLNLDMFQGDRCNTRQSKLAWFLIMWGGRKNISVRAQQFISMVTNFSQENHVFLPFLQGFLDDDPTVLRKSGRTYSLPDNIDDPLANILRSHPNVWVVRLSPTTPLSIEYIMLNSEYKSQLEGASNIFTFVRIPIFSQNYVSAQNEDTPTDATFSVVRNVVKSDGGFVNPANVLYGNPAPEPYIIENPTYGEVVDLFLQQGLLSGLLYFYLYSFLFIFQKGYEKKGYFAPIGWFNSDISTMWTDECGKGAVFPQITVGNVSDFIENLSNESYIGWSIATQFLNVDIDKSMVDELQPYMVTRDICKGMYPTLHSGLTVGCTTKEDWMVTDIPPPPSDVDALYNIYKVFQTLIQSPHSFWNCGTTENDRIWHLIRWLGYENILRMSNGTLDPEIHLFLNLMISSFSFFPFVDRNEMKHIRSEFEGENVYVLRLSAYKPMTLEIGFNENKELVFVTETDWMRWMTRIPHDVITSQTQTIPPLMIPSNPEEAEKLRAYGEFFIRTTIRPYFPVVSVGAFSTIWKSCNVPSPTGLTTQSISDYFNTVGQIVRDNVLRRTFKTWEDVSGKTLQLFSKDSVIGQKTFWNKVLGIENDGRTVQTEKTLSGTCDGGMGFDIDSSNSTQWVTKCKRDPNWIYSSPVYDPNVTYGDSSTSKSVAKFMNNIEKSVVSRRWCLSGKRGLRNKMIILNWIGPKCIDVMSGGSDTRCNKLKEVIDAAFNDPDFYPFINMYEAQSLALKYNGVILTIDPSTQGNFMIYTVKNMQTIEQESLSIEQIYGIIPSSLIKYIPFGIAIRLYIWTKYDSYLLKIDEPMSIDQQFCDKNITLESVDISMYLDSIIDSIPLMEKIPSQHVVDFLLLLNVHQPEILLSTDNYLKKPQYSILNPLLRNTAQRFINFFQGAARGGVQIMNAFAGILANETKDPGQYFDAKQATELLKISIIHEIDKERNAVKNQRPTQIGDVEIQWKRLVEDGIQYEEDSFGGFFKESFMNRIKNAARNVLIRGNDDPNIRQQEKGNSSFAATVKLQYRDAPDDILRMWGNRDFDGVKATLSSKLSNGQQLQTGENNMARVLGVIDRRGNVPTPALQVDMRPSVPVQDTSLESFIQPLAPGFQKYGTPTVQQTADEFYKDLHDADFEGNACMTDNSHHPYPAFEVINGKVVPRCSQGGWINGTTPDFNRMSESDNNLKGALLDIIKHWCPTVKHVAFIWRWIGINCMGQQTLRWISEKLFRDLSAGNYDKNATPVADVRRDAMLEEIRMLDEISSMAKNKTFKSDKCKARIMWLMDMINSGILFPFIGKSENAKKLNRMYPGRVVVMLDWNKSGSVVMKQYNSSIGKTFTQRYNVDDLFDPFIHSPVKTRMRVFASFSGGLCARNDVFVNDLRKAHGDPGCYSDLTQMKLYSIRSVLPVSDQKKFDFLLSEYNITKNVETWKQIVVLGHRASEYAKNNLNTKERVLYEQLLHFEYDPSPASIENAVSAYDKSSIEDDNSKAERYADMIVCQEPKYINYIRQKYKRKFPKALNQDIERMTRDELCSSLIGSGKFSSPVRIWQVTIDNPELIRDGFIDIHTHDTTKQSQINASLLKKYGLTIGEMREWNPDVNTDEMNNMRKRSVKAINQDKKEELEDMAAAAKTRSLLKQKNFCSNVTPTDEHCSGVRLGDLHLCKLSAGACVAEDYSAISLIGGLLDQLCRPNTPLLVSETNFLKMTYITLFYTMGAVGVKGEKVIRGDLFQMCRKIEEYFKKFVSNTTKYTFAVGNVRAVIDYVSGEYAMTQSGITGSGNKLVKNETVHEGTLWPRFTQRTVEEKYWFGLALMIRNAVMNGIILLD
jgi:hypothetical protein